MGDGNGSGSRQCPGKAFFVVPVPGPARGNLLEGWRRGSDEGPGRSATCVWT